MLIKDLYEIKTSEQESTQSNIQILLNKDHAIFKGHFPNHPVMPGVCMLQIIHELTERHIGHPIIMDHAKNVKFKAVINPSIHALLDFQLNISDAAAALITVKCTSKFEETTALQAKIIYKKRIP